MRRKAPHTITLTANRNSWGQAAGVRDLASRYIQLCSMLMGTAIDLRVLRFMRLRECGSELLPCSVFDVSELS